MKKYKKNDLRLALQAKMGQPVSEKEFARWFGIYCDMTGQSDDIRNAKELSANEVDALSKWLGYELTE